MAIADEVYQSLCSQVLETGYTYLDKSRDIELLQINNTQISFPVQKEFPLLTTKKVDYKNIATELIWFLRGDDDIKFLVENDCNIWNKDAYNYYIQESKYYQKEPDSFEVFDEKLKSGEYKGYVGPIYGVQWNNFNYEDFNQIQNLIDNLKSNPMSRRHIVTAWNPLDLPFMCLPPCHWSFEIIVKPEGNNYSFDLKWHQRSCDLFLGIPYNIASYATLGKIIEAVTGYPFINLIGDLSNVHIYANHIEQVKKQIERKPDLYSAPNFIIDAEIHRKLSISDNAVSITHMLRPEHFKVENYNHYPALRAEMIAPKY